MSGHSKWTQIKHKKAIADAKKGTIFGKLAKAIAMASRNNPDPSTNLRLKAEIDRAHAANMPADNIERALRRGAEKEASELTELQVELIGPGSVAIIVLAITDNANRTINEIKQLSASFGARMVNPGSVAWMFAKTGNVYTPQYPAEISDADTLKGLTSFLSLLREHDDVQSVYTNAILST